MKTRTSLIRDLGIVLVGALIPAVMLGMSCSSAEQYHRESGGVLGSGGDQTGSGGEAIGSGGEAVGSGGGTAGATGSGGKGGATGSGGKGSGGVAGSGGKGSGGVTGSGGVAGSGGKGSGGSGSGGSGSGGSGSGGASGGGGTTGTEPCVPAKTLATGTNANTGDFLTLDAYCFRVSGTIAGWGCSNNEASTGVRTLSVNNVTTACGGTLPSKWTDGYYYFSFGPGIHTYASVYWW